MKNNFETSVQNTDDTVLDQGVYIYIYMYYIAHMYYILPYKAKGQYLLTLQIKCTHICLFFFINVTRKHIDEKFVCPTTRNLILQ